jgi:hypothetical protein
MRFRRSTFRHDVVVAVAGVVVAGTICLLWLRSPALWVTATLVFAGLMAYLLWHDWPNARTHRRIMEGRCPACGYDRTGLPQSSTGPAPCPECGKRV